MKNLTLFCIVMLCLILCPEKSRAEGKVASPVSATGVPEASPAATALLVRLDQINAMDKTGLTSSEKKDLRKEVRSIKKELKTMNDGVYLSVGAIIIIILLLILLL
jgi:hypothetical protein